MSSLHQNKKIRAVSAKIKPNHSSQLKTQPSQIPKDIQPDQDTFHSYQHKFYLNPNKRHHRLKTTFNISHNDIELSRMLPKKAPKQRQELFQENLQLKQKINALNEQIALQKFKIQAQKKKTSHFTKKLGRQFQKQIFWTGNHQHLISGIKVQYQKLKQEYEQKCKQCQMIKKNIQFSTQQEYRIYAETLQQENKQLTRKIQSLLQPKYLDDRGNSQTSQYLLAEANIKNEKLYKKNVALSDRVSDLQSKLAQKQKKILFLQKLLIQRDNNQYHSTRKAKKLEKQKSILQTSINQLNDLLKSKQILHQNQTKRIQQAMDRKYCMQKQIFQRSLQEKNKKLQKVQKQVAYLSTLLSYWRPLDQLKNEDGNYPANLMKYKQDDESEISSVNRGSPNLGSGKVKLNSLLNEGNSIRVSAKSNNNIIRVNTGSNKNYNLNLSGLQDKSFNANVNNSFANNEQSQLEIIRKTTAQQQQQKLLKLNQNRVPKTASIRHSDKSLKARKIQLREIQFMSQTIRYKLIGSGISLEQAKNLFNYKVNFNSNRQEEFVIQDPWRKQYINMKQCKQILQKTPFCLSQPQAHNLSRYIVQDSNQQYVYCDQQNQILRSIAKSIFKAVVNDYVIPNANKCRQEWRNVLLKNKKNLSLALEAIAPNGTINANKYLDILYSLGMQVSDECRLWLAGQLMINSTHIDKCSYKMLFDV